MTTSTTCPPISCTFNVQSLKNTTLVVPTVSTGNVPQLVADLLVTSLVKDPKAQLALDRVGDLGHPYLLNICGPDAYGVIGRISMPLEVYLDPHRKITVLQQRAPIVQGYSAAFTQALVEWIKTVGFARVVLVASSDAAFRTDTLIEGTPSFRVITVPGEHAVPSDLPVKRLEPDFADGKLKGSANLSHLLASAKAGLAPQIPVTALVVFTLEGDNLQDTLMTYQHLSKLLDLPTNTRFPLSWQDLYGTNTSTDSMREVY
ncbi:Proteasome assembly chaperone 2 [Allomyces javanicus]|nr:Proteasome assembly chaperone 2 [Allomyces javanicus]